MITVKEEFLRSDKVRRAVKAAGPAVVLVWLALKTYTAEHLTDGFIPDEDVDAVDALVDARCRRAALDALVSCGRLRADGTRGAGLLERRENGYQLHDYLEHEQSAEVVLERRRLKADRQKRWRRGKRVDAVDAQQYDYETVSETPTRRAGDASPTRARAPVPPPPPPPVDPEVADPSDQPPQHDPPSGSFLSSPDPDLPGRSESRASARLVFDHWAAAYHPKAKLDRKREARIRARLSEGFTAEQLCEAIDGARRDPWLMGEDPNSSRRYDGLESLLRDAAQVERLIELKSRPVSAIRRGPREDAFAREMREIREMEAEEAESKTLQEVLR